ncbi:MAG: hypothetical protein MPL62_04830 [Alphaproteobacteria bacterium]|nr:hypothetical protein [Alphaproteobacteria bacterium]
MDTRNAAPSMKPSKQIYFLRASPHPSASIARLSGCRKSLKLTPTNAKDRASSVP